MMVKSYRHRNMMVKCYRHRNMTVKGIKIGVKSYTVTGTEI